MINIAIVVGLILGWVYASLLVYAGLTQLRTTDFPQWSIKILIFFGIILDLSIVLRLFGIIWSLILIIISLVGIQLMAVYNGWYAYKKIDIKHQSVRIVLSLCIIVLILV